VAGEDVGEAGFGDSVCLGKGDFCGVLYDPETRLSNSRDVGFLGIPGEEGFGELIDSGRGEGLGKTCGSETVRSSSEDSDFLRGSGGEALAKAPEEMRADLAGVAGLSVEDCLAGVLATGRSFWFGRGSNGSSRYLLLSLFLSLLRFGSGGFRGGCPSLRSAGTTFSHVLQLWSRSSLLFLRRPGRRHVYLST